MDIVRSKPIPESSVQIDNHSRTLLASIASNDETFLGKVVFARFGDKAIMAVGSRHEFHADIINRSCRELLGMNISEIGGIVIQGGFFTFSDNGKITVFGKSTTFKGFEAGIFEEHTDKVAQRLIAQEIQILQNGDLGRLKIPQHFVA